MATTARSTRTPQKASTSRSGASSARGLSPDEADRTGRPAIRGHRRRPGLPLLTVTSLPVVIAGTRILGAEGADAIESDVVYVLLAIVTLMAAGFLMAVLGLLLFVLMDRERTERLVMILTADTERRRRRRRRRRKRD